MADLIRRGRERVPLTLSRPAGDNVCRHEVNQKPGILAQGPKKEAVATLEGAVFVRLTAGSGDHGKFITSWRAVMINYRLPGA